MMHPAIVLGVPVEIELMEFVGPAEVAGEPELWGFLYGDRVQLISQVVDGWTCAEHRYVEVAVQNGRRFLLRRDGTTTEWTASALVRSDRQ